jgi:murein DD-endopeptidase MepM/ murein hydrolase activator NlpD
MWLGLVACSGDEPSGPGGNCGEYPDWESSPYVLPYPPGSTYQVVQANCSSADAYWNSHIVETPWTYAYDFLMPIGSEITAVRSGIVAAVRENFTDNDKGLEQGNVVVIDHFRH